LFKKRSRLLLVMLRHHRQIRR